MHISGLHSQSTIQHTTEGSQPLGDMLELFGGTLEQNPTPEDQPTEVFLDNYYSTNEGDELVAGTRYIDHNGQMASYIQIPRLFNTQQARRWTAIEAYKAKIIEMDDPDLKVVDPFSKLELELRGQYAADQWRSKKAAVLDKYRQAADTKRLEEYMDTGRKINHQRSGSREREAQVEQALADYFSRCREGKDTIILPFDITPTDVYVRGSGSHVDGSKLTAVAGSLIEAARIMQNNYAEIDFAGSNELAVPHALGAISIGHLEYVMVEAMAQDTPKESALFALRALAAGNGN